MFAVCGEIAVTEVKFFILIVKNSDFLDFWFQKCKPEEKLLTLDNLDLFQGFYPVKIQIVAVTFFFFFPSVSLQPFLKLSFSSVQAFITFHMIP